ncbi:hypothetical protein PHLGIDRAFT_286995 [Phlebiopsis gigantea 11061_1 CR5-6]|uniref:Cytochrome b561 domain-containing protein n=1 Tax=Phlebiopsis gigantea (strain 11061_1 CR5-6) TaxID=745531 RepID=A0A0C3S3S5_PHLG1|nr:hypothetical protein PHLGIDRAFT_286995 [Phlebiopsis gigantea 11061_1 CR5-6]
MGFPLLPFEKYIVAHAILMVIGFLFLLPLGAIVARWMRTYNRAWFTLHWILQFALALPIIVCGFALGVTAVNKNDRLPVNDPHKKWGIAIFVLYLFQLAFGAAVHFVKRPFLSVRHRAFQNYFHPLFGVFLIGIAFYQVRTGFRTEWPLYTGRGKVRNGANIVWIVWLVLVPTFYFGGMLLLPRQYKQERAARDAQLRSGSDAGSTAPVQPKAA